MATSKRYSEIFREAQSIIERGWTKGIFARNGHNQSVAQGDPSAICWCLDGAVGLAEGRRDNGSSIKIFQFMADVLNELFYFVDEDGGALTLNAVSFNDMEITSSTSVIQFLKVCELSALDRGL